MSKIKKLLTLDDLYKFCKEQNFSKFSSKENGYQLSVQIPATFEVENEEYQDDTLLFGKVKVLHIGPNRNGSSVTKEAAEKALNTIAYKPLLANFCEIDGEKDFTSHDMEFNEDGTITYIERQIGCFTSDLPVIQYDETTEKEFIFAKVAIPREYSDACEIIERKNGTKVSAEIIVNEMQYSAKDDILELTDIIFQGATCLGKNPETGDAIEEGMQGARLDIIDFSVDKNSIVNKSDTDINDTLVDALKKLNDTLEKFNNITNSNEEGGEKNTMNKFEELLELYGLEESEIEFEVKGLSDEELEAKFTEIYGDAEEFKKKKRCSDENDEEEDESEEDEDFAGCGKKKKRCSINKEAGIIEFELSHDDIRMALYGLLKSDNDDNYYLWICEVYDSYFIYQKESYDDGDFAYKYYKQGYSRNGDDIELSGDSIEVFSTFVTESEKAALEMMRSQYDELKAFKDAYDAKLLKDQKNDVFARKEYAAIADTDEFKTLVSDMDKYSVEEIEVKCDLLFAGYAKSIGEFSAKQNGGKPTAMRFSVKSVDEANKKPYGNLFD